VNAVGAREAFDGRDPSLVKAYGKECDAGQEMYS
jgi:hypothetical protein